MSRRGPRGVERRRSPRAEPEELPEPVSVVGTRLLDISHGGLAIEAPVPLAPESSLRLRLVLRGVKTELETRVADCRRRTSDRGRPWGVGVEFTDVPQETRHRLSEVLNPKTLRARKRPPRSA